MNISDFIWSNLLFKEIVRKKTNKMHLSHKKRERERVRNCPSEWVALELTTQKKEGAGLQIPGMELSRQEKSKRQGTKAGIYRTEGQTGQVAESQRAKER